MLHRHGLLRFGQQRRVRGAGLSPRRLGLIAVPAAVVALLVGLWLAGFGGALLALLPARGDTAVAPPGEVTITSDPTDAQVIIDGKARGRTPLTLRLPGGERRLTLRRDGYADLTVTARVAADRPAAVAGTLWRAAPVARQLRPPLPGAAIAGAQFLADGSVALTVTLPPGQEQQLWVVDAAGGVRRVGPVEARLAIAPSPDGARVAYAAPGAALASGVGTGGEPPSAELWIADADGAASGVRRLALPPSTAAERLVDLAWAPDGRQLLVAAQLRPQGGGVRTRLLLVDADGDGPPVELVALPSDVVAGSWTWRPDGGQVAFVARAEGRLSLCVLATAPAARPGAPPLFRYLADLPAGQAPFAAPVTWTSSTADAPGRVIYAAPAPAPPGTTSGPRPTVLFADDLGGHPPTRLGDGAGGWPTWRGDGQVLAIAKGKKDAVVLRAVDLTAASGAGLTSDLATLALGWGGGEGPGIRWDTARGRALLLRPGGWGGEAGELWLLDWRDDEDRRGGTHP